MKQTDFAKKRIFEIIEVGDKKDIASRCYDMMLNIAIIVSMIPLTFNHYTPYTKAIDVITVIIFIIDYVARIYTSEYKMGVFSKKAYLVNILRIESIVDLLSIVPIVALIFPAVSYARLFKLFRVVRIFKLARYSKTMVSIANVLRRVRRPLGTVLLLAVIYIFISAATLYQIEPYNFDTFLDALYWSTISATSIGYGDFTPTTNAGKIVASISAVVSVAVIALPSGIITAAYMKEISKKKGAHEL